MIGLTLKNTLRQPSSVRPLAAARASALPRALRSIAAPIVGIALLLVAGTLNAYAQGVIPSPGSKPGNDPLTTGSVETPAATQVASSPQTIDDLFKTPAIRFSPDGKMVPSGNNPAALPLPYAPTGRDAPDVTNQGQLNLSARLVPSGPEVNNGITWRVYSETIGASGRLDLMATATGGSAQFNLDPGSYLVHAAYGHAGAAKRITIGRMVHRETIVLNAGGLKLNAVVAKTMPLVGDDIRFDVYEMDFDERGERRMIARDIAPAAIARLNAGTYHVVSRYGTVNAVVRADIRVEPGKLTEATIYHNAARVTLKLVNESGGEALANTTWSVLTPGGDAVVDGTGAFPSYVLAAGSYTVIARHMEKIFSHDFEVDSGLDREIEVKAALTN